ncbi:MAG: MOSC domain-containing protein [Pseudomonadota bacterium]|nr:MOSC domain-containing protein [Pseudomonadota bacterium]
MSQDTSLFHRGEREIQERLGVRDRTEHLGRRMIHPRMHEGQRTFLEQLPMLVVGTLDEARRPWASVLAGEPGFVHGIDPGTLAVKARPVYGDPLTAALVKGADIGTLGIELENRTRLRVNGRIQQVDDAGFRIRISQSYGNCPQYIQAREICPDADLSTIGEPRPVRRGNALNRAEAALIARSDTFFVASHYSEDREDRTQGVDVSHRGGRPSFVVVAHETSLLFPDYSGNCMFNTLGNILMDPRCGLLFIDFANGDTLQMTGEAEILWERAHTSRFAGAERVVAFRIDETLFIEKALPFDWAFRGYSPVLDTLQPIENPSPPAQQPAQMSLAFVNVAMPKEVIHEGKAIATGIFKQPVDGRVMVRWLNVDCDGQADLWGHGGAFRAVYVYSLENYAYWRKELGRDLPYGQFGENFTVEGMSEEVVCVGDIYRIGGTLLEVSQPRVPCFKLAIKMGIEGFQNRFLKSGRIGFYFKVLEEGEVGAGDAIELVSRDPRGMSVRQISDLLYFDPTNIVDAEKALSIPALSHGWKRSFEERLAKAAEKQRPGLDTFLVDRKVPESETVTSFYLVPDAKRSLPRFLPGQFLTFALDIPGADEPVIRTYSLSDSPNPDYYRVSIKRETAPENRKDVPPGLASSFFHDCVDVGARIRAAPPRGKFTLDLDSDRTVVLLSGGIGLTPMVSMLNAVVDGGSKRSVWFIHGTRSGAEHALGEAVRALADAHDNVHVHVRYSRPRPIDIKGRDYDSEGRVDIALLKELLAFDDYEFYLCGPPPFMKSLYCGLTATGVLESRVHYEFFGPSAPLIEEAKPAGQAHERSVDEELIGDTPVDFARSGLTATWDPDCASILELAEHKGLSPPFSCRSGICQTCMCRVIEGEVEYFEEPLVKPDEGQALICVSRPRTKLVLDV